MICTVQQEMSFILSAGCWNGQGWSNKEWVSSMARIHMSVKVAALILTGLFLNSNYFQVHLVNSSMANFTLNRPLRIAVVTAVLQWIRA